jgi:hypothetical protein
MKIQIKSTQTKCPWGWFLLVFTILILCPLNGLAQADCPSAITHEFECADSDTGCRQTVFLRDCVGSDNIFCCNPSYTQYKCCGNWYDSALQDAGHICPHCGGGDVVVDPKTGRAFKACDNRLLLAFISGGAKSNKLPSGG